MLFICVSIILLVRRCCQGQQHQSRDRQDYSHASRQAMGHLDVTRHMMASFYLLYRVKYSVKDRGS
jgi:hypothetical protein